jgi:hypothetical protein
MEEPMKPIEYVIANLGGRPATAEEKAAYRARTKTTRYVLEVVGPLGYVERGPLMEDWAFGWWRWHAGDPKDAGPDDHANGISLTQMGFQSGDPSVPPPWHR